MEAAKWLTENCKLYQDEGIQVNANWNPSELVSINSTKNNSNDTTSDSTILYATDSDSTIVYDTDSDSAIVYNYNGTAIRYDSDSDSDSDSDIDSDSDSNSDTIDSNLMTGQRYKVRKPVREIMTRCLLQENLLKKKNITQHLV